MKATLTFELPEEQESLEEAIHASEWKSALEAIWWQVLCWEQGKPDGQTFPNRGAEEPVAEMRPVLELTLGPKPSGTRAESTTPGTRGRSQANLCAKLQSLMDRRRKGHCKSD